MVMPDINGLTDTTRQCRWWALAILAHNLNAAMNLLVFDKGWQTKRMKPLSLHLIAPPGRVLANARGMMIRLIAGAEALARTPTTRQTIRALAHGPSG